MKTHTPAQTLFLFLSLFAAKPSERNTTLQNYIYRLCSNVMLTTSRDTILGHNFILYLRVPDEPVKLDVYFLRTMNASPPWDELVANRSIPVNASGWQVFHLKSETDPIVENSVCVDMYVREINTSGERAFLNQTQIAERFVLDDSSLDEIANQPFVATFMLHHGTITLPPFFGKRSVRSLRQPSCSRHTNCSLQSHRVNPANYFSVAILYPQEIDLGWCGNTEHLVTNTHTHSLTTDEDEEKNESSGVMGSGDVEVLNKSTQLYQCVPSEYNSVLMLIKIDNQLVIELIPDLIIAGCTLQPCSREI